VTDTLQLIRDAPPLEIYDTNIDIRQLRLKRAAVTASQPIANPGVDYLEEDRKIPMRDGMSITVRTHQPRVTPSDGCPGLVMFHGGGFCLGNLENETEFCRRWADLGGVAVNVDYRLAPEFSFPTPVYDAYDALKWVSCEP
jgi:acetyl esterase/lipase